jgi:hypothetical protein
MAARKRQATRASWPILERAGDTPKGWQGWPDGKQFALVLTHDVDTAKGQARCFELAKMEKELGFRSSFNFVPERYDVSPELRDTLMEWGFEVGVHGLNHDGKLFRSQTLFTERAQRINRYLADWGAVGFRSPAMHHDLDWIGDLNIAYDSSTFDSDPFQPQPDAIETIFPFSVNGRPDRSPYVEMPCTMPQDFVLFTLLRERTNRIWEKKVEWIAHKGGMAMMNTHPDYMHFGSGTAGLEDYPAEYYRNFLVHLKEQFKNLYWHPLPHEIAKWFSGAAKQEESIVYRTQSLQQMQFVQGD